MIRRFVAPMGRNNLLLMISLFVWALGEGLWINLRQLYLVQLGATPEQVGFALAIESVAHALLLIPAGYIADRIGAFRVAVFAWGLGLLGALLMIPAPVWQWAVPGMVIYAFSYIAVPSISVFVLMSIPDSSIPGIDQRVLTAVFATYPAGLILSPVIGGWVADHWGIRACLGIACALFVVSVGVILFARHIPPVISEPHERPRDLLQHRTFWILALYFGVGAFALRLGDLLAPNYLEDVRLLTFGVIGLLFSINALGNVATNLIAGRMSRRWSYLIVLAFMWVGLLGVWRGHSMVILIGSFFAMGAVWTGHTISAAGVASIVPPRNRGLAFGIMDTMIATGTAIAAPISGALYVSSPAHDRPFMAALIALPIGGLIWLLVRRVLPAELPLEVPTLVIEELESPEGVIG